MYLNTMQNQDSYSNEDKAQVRPSNMQNLKKTKLQQHCNHVNNFTSFLQIKILLNQIPT